MRFIIPALVGITFWAYILFAAYWVAGEWTYAARYFAVLLGPMACALGVGLGVIFVERFKGDE